MVIGQFSVAAPAGQARKGQGSEFNKPVWPGRLAVAVADVGLQ